MNEPRTIQCPECRGMGDCPTCDGTGKVEAARTADRPSLPSRNQLAAALHDSGVGCQVTAWTDCSRKMHPEQADRILAALRQALEDQEAALRAGGSPEWVALANDIRIVDGNHDLGAGALAEALPMSDRPVSSEPLTARIERAEREVVRLTGSGPRGMHDRHFRMTIPAEPDRDSDLVLMDGLAAGREAIATLDAARSATPSSEEDAWLIERGQSRKQTPPIYWRCRGALPSDTDEWTDDPWKAARFSTRAAAEEAIHSLEVRLEAVGDPVEHAFLAARSATPSFEFVRRERRGPMSKPTEEKG